MCTLPYALYIGYLLCVCVCMHACVCACVCVMEVNTLHTFSTTGSTSKQFIMLQCAVQESSLGKRNDCQVSILSSSSSSSSVKNHLKISSKAYHEVSSCFIVPADTLGIPSSPWVTHSPNFSYDVTQLTECYRNQYRSEALNYSLFRLEPAQKFLRVLVILFFFQQWQALG